MKWTAIIIIILFGCVSTRKTTRIVLLDSSKSYVTGGNGNGFFTAWNWKQIEGTGIIDNPNIATTTAKVYTKNNSWQMIITDNLGQQKTDTVYLQIK